MTAAVYWDTSAVLKLYAPEADSQRYRQLLIAQAGPLAVSKLHDVELFYALRGKELRGEITLGSATLLFKLYQSHVRQGRYLTIPWTDAVATESRQILEHCTNATPSVLLRSLDGLHLGTLRSANLTSIVTADLKMRQAAVAVAISSIEPS